MKTWIWALRAKLGLSLSLAAQQSDAPLWSVNCSNLARGETAGYDGVLALIRLRSCG
ncbi:hypothetical protein [Ruegeria sp. MALMAid1280]|uniref:hypothetical protein n=1 Tax=Ruegeria sp. MALMAid1280 TaxID=3411634 RepID=UPI003BA31F67